MNTENGRHIDVCGILMVDPRNGSTKINSNGSTLKLSPTDITYIRILCDGLVHNASSIAKDYEDSYDLNKAMLLATSNMPVEQRLKSLKILDGVDKRKDVCTTIECVRVRMCSLRKRIGKDLIQDTLRFGYNLGVEEENNNHEQFGVLRVDLDGGKSVNTVTGHRATISQGDIKMLRCLSKKRWITTEEISHGYESDNLDGQKDTMSDDNIRVSINNLRNKIGENTIVTKNGYGYHLVEERELVDGVYKEIIEGLTEVGMLEICPENGYCKRIDNGKEFNLSKGDIEILLSISKKYFVKTIQIAKDIYNKDIDCDDTDQLANIRTRIFLLRREIGTDLITENDGSGYHLVTKEEFAKNAEVK